MYSNSKFIIKGFGYIFLLFLFCEYFIYYFVLFQCKWPELNTENEDKNIKVYYDDPVKVMILADTHLLGSRNGHWFDKLRREWQMHRAFQTAMILHKPDLVFVLGDLTDEGLWCSSSEFNAYVKRFYSLFAVPEGTQMYVVVGNHDIGFHYGISPYLNQRFISAFNASAVQLISFKGNHFVLINSMALEGDGCFLCKPAEKQITQIEARLKCTQGTGKCGSISKLNQYSRPILMQHFPLYRPSDSICTDDDAAPLAIRNTVFREKWDCLSKEATSQLLNTLKPRLAFAGHTHHGCKKELPNNGTEYTIPSFSWRNKDNPNYAMVIITPNNHAVICCKMPRESVVVTRNNHAISKCQMPRESTVNMIYILGVLLVSLILVNQFRKMPRRPGRRMFKIQ